MRGPVAPSLWVLEVLCCVPSQGVCLGHGMGGGLFLLHFSPFLLIKLIAHSQLEEDIIKMMGGN